MPNGGLPTWVQARLHGALDLRQSCMQEGILDNRALGELTQLLCGAS